MIIFIYGADTFRSRRFLQELKDKFTRDVDPLAQSISILDGAAADLKMISGQADTGSLFVKKRLVIVNDIFQSKKEKIFGELATYLEKIGGDKDNILIFRDGELNTKNKPVKAAAKKLFALLTKQPYSREFPQLNDSQLVACLKKEAAAYGKDISAPAASRLIGKIGRDLWPLAVEIKKLAFYTAAKEISVADVEALTVGAIDENIFGLTDALSARNKTAAARLLEEQYAAGLSDEYLITMLIRQFKILSQLRAEIDAGNPPASLAGKLKLHPYVVQKGLGQAKNFSADALRGTLNRLIGLDFRNKTGQGETRTELLVLIAEL